MPGKSRGVRGVNNGGTVDLWLILVLVLVF